MVVVGQKVARKHDRGFGVGIDGRSNGLDREQDRGRGGCRCCRCGIPGFGLCSAIGQFTPGPVPVRWLQQQTRPWVLDGSRVGPVPPGQQERKQAEKCIARHAHLPAQAASWASHSPRPRRRRGGPREAQAVGRARPDMRNQNQNGHRMQESRFGERHRRGRHKHRHRRESLGSTHGCTPHVCSILKLRLEQESGSAIQDPRNGNRAELRVRLDPFGFIDRLDVTANLNSGDENNETGKMTEGVSRLAASENARLRLGVSRRRNRAMG